MPHSPSGRLVTANAMAARHEHKNPTQVVFTSGLESEDHLQTVTGLLKSQHTRDDY